MSGVKQFFKSIAALFLCAAMFMCCIEVKAEETDGAVDGATASNLFVLKAHSVAVTDSFDLKYYLSVSDAVRNDSTSYVQFTLGGEKQISYVTDNAYGYAVYTCRVSAKQLNETVKAELYYKGSFYNIGDYSVKKYLDTILGNEEYSYAADIVRAILNYGGYAQQYFEYNTSNLVNGGLYAAGQNPVELLSDSQLTNCENK